MQNLVLVRDAGMWRGINNVAANTGRAAGGTLGGWLSDMVGYIWSFIGQGRIMGLAFALVAWKLKLPSHEDGHLAEAAILKGHDMILKLKRIDLGCAVLVTSSVVLLILAINPPNQGVPWTSPMLLGYVTASLLLVALFLRYESLFPSGPIYPPRLLQKRSVWDSYICLSSVLWSQLSWYSQSRSTSRSRRTRRLAKPAHVSCRMCSQMPWGVCLQDGV